MMLLLVEGEFNDVDATVAWEGIIRDNCKATNNRKYQQYMDARKQLLTLCNEREFVKVAFEKLHFEVDRDVIKELAQHGYRISTESSQKYAESLVRCEIQARGLNTRIKLQEKFIEQVHKDQERNAKNKSVGMQQSLARIGAALGIVLPQDILLATFNEHYKIVMQQESNNRRKAA